MKSRTDSRKFKTLSRRELLKLTPVLALGAFARSSRNRSSKAALPLAIGHRRGCFAPFIWHPRLLTPT